MNLFKIIIVLATIATTTLVASENDTSSTKKPEESKTDLATTKKSDEPQTELNFSQSAPNKRSIASYGNHGYNNNNALYGYNKQEPRSRKNKSRNRKSRRKNKKSGRFNKFGRGRQVFRIDNNTPQLKIENTKPIININFDSVYKDPNNNDPITNLKNQIFKNAHSNYMEPQQGNRKSRSGTNQSKVEHSESKMQNETYNMTTEPDQQNLKPVSKELVTENSSLVIKDEKNIHESKSPDTQSTDYKVLDQENIKSIKKYEPTIQTDVQPQKADVFEHKFRSDLQQQTIISLKNNNSNVGDTIVVSTLSSISTPHLNRSELETKKPEGDIVKLQSKSDSELKVEFQIKQSEADLKQTNIQNKSERETTILKSKITESDLIRGDAQIVNTETKNTNFEFGKNSKPITRDTEYQPLSTETERKESRKRENNITELTVNSEVKIDSKKSDKFDESTKAVKPSYTSTDIKKNTVPELKRYEPEIGKLNTENTNKGPGYTSIDLEDLLSELGIKASEPENAKVDFKPKPKPKSNILAPDKLEPDSRELKPTESQDTRSTQITESIQTQSQPDSKDLNIEKSRTSRKSEIEKGITKHVYTKIKTKPEQKFSNSEYVKNLSDKNAEPKLPKLTPNHKPQLKPNTLDPKYKIVDLRSARYDPYSKEYRHEFKAPNPESKFYQDRNSRPLSEQNRSEYEKPKKELSNSSSAPKEYQPKNKVTLSEFENSKPGQKKVEARREYRQSKSEDKEEKIPISIPTTRAESKFRNTPPRIRPDNPKYKNSVPNYQSTDADYETAVKQSKTILPGYINPESKSSIPEPKNQRSETRYKKSQFVYHQENDRTQDKVSPEYDRKPEVAPKPEYVNIKNVPRKFEANYQESRTSVNDRVLETRKPIPELKINNPKYWSPKRETIDYEPKYKEVNQGSRKAPRDYKKPDYQIRESEYRKPSYEKYQPEIRRTKDDSLKVRPSYAFENREEAKVKVYSNSAREGKKTILNRKYRSDKKNDEPQYNESKIQYKISESTEKNSQIEYKNSESEDSKSTTEKFQLESTAPLTEHSITVSDEKEENSTQKQNFFYKAIKDWW